MGVKLRGQRKHHVQLLGTELRAQVSAEGQCVLSGILHGAQLSGIVHKISCTPSVRNRM